MVLKKLAKNVVRKFLGFVPLNLQEQIRFNQLGRQPPDLMWKTCRRSPITRTESAGVKINQQYFMLGGYHTLDSVLAVADVFDLNRRQWTDQIAMPAGMPQTHLGIAGDGVRYIYAVGGQLGPQCHPCVADCFVLDTQTRKWSKLPPLPEPRYAPTVQLWRGRLHALSGSKPDRCTPATEHWSIAVDKGRALEDRWREEVPVPRGGPHRASAVFGDRLYVFGGEEGDVKPIAGDLQYTCDWSTPLETTYGDSFMLQHEAQHWKPIATMLERRSHTEYSVVKIGPYAVIVGGIEERYKYTDIIQVYDTQADHWRLAGRLPYLMKTAAVYHDGWLFLMNGQRGNSITDPRPGKVLDTVWRTKFDPAQTC